MNDEDDINDLDYQTIVFDDYQIKIQHSDDEGTDDESEYTFDNCVEDWISEHSESLLDAYIEIMMRSQMTHILNMLKFPDFTEFVAWQQSVSETHSEVRSTLAPLQGIDFDNLPVYKKGTYIKNPSIEEWISVNLLDLEVLYKDLFHMYDINIEEFCNFCYSFSSGGVEF